MPLPSSARAVVLPAKQARTVVIPPCNTPVSATVRGAARRVPVPGATTVQLPGRSGFYTLLVPHCQPGKTGTTNVQGDIPSAAFVLPGRGRLPKNEEGKLVSDGIAARSQLLLPEGSSTSTIVVPPCKSSATKGRDSLLSPRKGNSKLAVGPAC